MQYKNYIDYVYSYWINFRDNQIGPEGAVKIGEGIANLHNLTHINLNLR